MKILVIGSGGREHAIVEAISRSPKASKIYAAPGNAGIAQLAECVAIKETEVEKLKAFAIDNNISLTVVGPEAALEYLRTHASLIKKNAIVVDTCGVKGYVCDGLVHQIGTVRIGCVQSCGRGYAVPFGTLLVGKGIVACQSPICQNRFLWIQRPQVTAQFGEVLVHIVHQVVADFKMSVGGNYCHALARDIGVHSV